MLKMDSYIDDKYAILDETLLTITNPEETLVIPPEVNGHRIKRIANGLFVGKNVKTIIISEGITEIGAEAFAGTDNLEKLILPESLKVLGSDSFDTKRGSNKFPPDIYLKRLVSREDFNLLWNNSIPMYSTGQRRMLTAEHRIMPEFSEIYKGFGRFKPPKNLERDMLALFYYKGKNENGRTGQITEYSFQGVPILWQTPEDNRTDFRVLMSRFVAKNRPRPIYDEKSERLHNRQIQLNKVIHTPGIIITEFDTKAVTEINGMMSLTFQVRLGYAFYGGHKKVVYRGRNYYVYYDHYINPYDEECEYQVVDWLDYIVDEEGNQVDKETATAVAVKYKFSMILS